MSKQAIPMILTLVALVGASGYVITRATLDKRSEPTPETYKECVNRIAYDAFVDADVGNTFDAGFDAGLVAEKECSK